ncbi:MAG: Tat pathway signal sequence, partial [Planctomycetota bacterium]
MNLYWGDIHNHNGIGYGKGSMERSYDLARNNLDFYAFTPHGWWPDIPSAAPHHKKYHLDAFETVKQKYADIIAKANSENKDGCFTAFIAFEWHSCG